MVDILTDITGARDLPRWFSRIFPVVQNLQRGRIEFHLADGRVFRAEGSQPGAHGEIHVQSSNLFARILRDGELGFCEAYMDGDWTSPDLQAVMDVLLENNQEVVHNVPGIGLVRAWERFRHWLRSNSKRQAPANIAAHYDLGNAFYAEWLDPTMTYSSALFRNGQQDLTAAQGQKYDNILQMIGAKQGDHLLEIGCGWGGFAEHAVKTRGARVTGLTLSQAQADFARKRMFDAGMADLVDIQIRDYRDEQGQYDGIASIEMFEAVGEKYWPTYFDTLRERLKPDAQAGLQIITVADHLFDGYRKGVDFIQKYIFPGGMLPSSAALVKEYERAGLIQTDTETMRESYSTTLRQWRHDFNAAWDRIEPMGFDRRFYRMWNLYLASCAATFAAGTTDVIQVGLRRE